MTTEQFDDGLVHDHGWANHSRAARKDIFPIADVRFARTPSTVYHDDQMVAE